MPFWAIFWRRSEKKVEKTRLPCTLSFYRMKMTTTESRMMEFHELLHHLWRHQKYHVIWFFSHFFNPNDPKNGWKSCVETGVERSERKNFTSKSSFVWDFSGFFSYKLLQRVKIFSIVDSTLFHNGIRFLNSVKNSWFPALLSTFQSNIHPDFYPSLTVTAESIPMGIPTVKCLVASDIFTRLYRRYFPSSTSAVKVNTIVAHTGAYRSNSVDFYIFWFTCKNIGSKSQIVHFRAFLDVFRNHEFVKRLIWWKFHENLFGRNWIACL